MSSENRHVQALETVIQLGKKDPEEQVHNIDVSNGYLALLQRLFPATPPDSTIQVVLKFVTVEEKVTAITEINRVLTLALQTTRNNPGQPVHNVPLHPAAHIIGIYGLLDGNQHTPQEIGMQYEVVNTGIYLRRLRRGINAVGSLVDKSKVIKITP